MVVILEVPTFTIILKELRSNFLSARLVLVYLDAGWKKLLSVLAVSSEGASSFEYWALEVTMRSSISSVASQTRLGL